MRRRFSVCLAVTWLACATAAPAQQAGIADVYPAAAEMIDVVPVDPVIQGVIENFSSQMVGVVRSPEFAAAVLSPLGADTTEVLDLLFADADAFGASLRGGVATLGDDVALAAVYDAVADLFGTMLSDVILDAGRSDPEAVHAQVWRPVVTTAGHDLARNMIALTRSGGDPGRTVNPAIWRRVFDIQRIHEGAGAVLGTFDMQMLSIVAAVENTAEIYHTAEGRGESSASAALFLDLLADVGSLGPNADQTDISRIMSLTRVGLVRRLLGDTDAAVRTRAEIMRIGSVAETALAAAVWSPLEWAEAARGWGTNPVERAAIIAIQGTSLAVLQQTADPANAEESGGLTTGVSQEDLAACASVTVTAARLACFEALAGAAAGD